MGALKSVSRISRTTALERDFTLNELPLLPSTGQVWEQVLCGKEDFFFLAGAILAILGMLDGTWGITGNARKDDPMSQGIGEWSSLGGGFQTCLGSIVFQDLLLHLICTYIF